jgi:hypothetical protein
MKRDRESTSRCRDFWRKVPAEFSYRRIGFQIENNKPLPKLHPLRVFEVMRNDDYSDVALGAEPESPLKR